MFKSIKAKPDFPALEEKILDFWKKNKIFEKSIKQRSKNNQFVFYDGPPFVTGLPHYGHLLGSIAKDVIPRYVTMKGKRVPRVWGWDCHGLPVEEKTEKKLGLKNRRDIEKIGIDKFINECRKYVSKTSAEWNWYIDHIGRWVDMKNDYRTMDLKYMESVIWVFKQIYDKGLIYQGLKTLLYCTRCGTPVSKFEIAMDDSYAMMKDPAVTIKFKIKEGKFKNTFIAKHQTVFILAWTTTPWTLPSNRALVVDKEEKYVQIKVDGQKDLLILSKKRLKISLAEKEFKILDEFKGEKLIGFRYEPLYTFFPSNKKDFKIYHYKNMVSMEEGTGVVHSAPGFGEIDTEMGKHFGLTLMFGVDNEGKFVDEVKKWAGVYVKDADDKIIDDLEKRNLLFKKEIIVHRYPYCYRCETPLIYKSVKAWFINIQKIKKKMMVLNKNINWVPNYLKKGRVDYTIQEAPDWCISRTRYWATVMPVWQCEKCGEIKVVGSIKEIEENSVKKEKVLDLHRTGVDNIKFKCSKCGGLMSRIPEVLDVWFESGSMPYGQKHYPFENKLVFEKTFPADYISEYTGQIRAWFYYLHALSTVLFKSHSFKNVIVSGVMTGTDGRKMSKSYENFPDPKNLLQKHGGDALRLYLMGSVLMLGRDMNITDGEAVKEQVKTVLLPFWNSYRFLVTFANLHHWQSPSIPKTSKPKNILDCWIASRLNQFNQSFSSFMDKYYLPQATHLIKGFVDDLSKWYIRRSRDRFIDGDKKALETLHKTLVTFSKIIAPIAPFITEEIYKNLTDKDSVHLQDWPIINDKLIDKKLEAQMTLVQQICELGHSERKRSNIKVRQPLKQLSIINYQLSINDQLLSLIKEELNVKKVTVRSGKDELKVKLDTQITPALKAEGRARDLIRQIQSLRKKKSCRLDQQITVTAPDWPEQFENYIKKKTLAKKLSKGKELSIK